MKTVLEEEVLVGVSVKMTEVNGSSPIASTENIRGGTRL